MTTASQALSRAIQSASGAFLFFTSDLAGADWTHRPCKDAVCAAWIAGHLTLSARGMLKTLGVVDLPALPEGFEKRFARDETAPRSDDYGDVTILRDLFKTTHDHLAKVVTELSKEKLAEALPRPTMMFATIGELAAFAPTHIGMHTGQISTIRRSLGRPPLV